MFGQPGHTGPSGDRHDGIPGGRQTAGLGGGDPTQQVLQLPHDNSDKTAVFG